MFSVLNSGSFYHLGGRKILSIFHLFWGVNISDSNNYHPQGQVLCIYYPIIPTATCEMGESIPVSQEEMANIPESLC